MDEIPPVSPVLPEYALFQLKRHSTRERLLAFVPQPFHILRMKGTLTKVPRLNFFQGKTGILEHTLV